jgi:hypothetical protein
MFVFAAIAIRLAVGNGDRNRIEDYIRQMGGRIESIEWTPNFFGPKGTRQYDVVYDDSTGQRRCARCRTSTFGSVWWTDDRPINPGPDRAMGFPVVGVSTPPDPSQEIRRQEAENAQLRERLRASANITRE